MRVFVAGATGAIGRLLVPQLLAGGFIVTGTSRTTAGIAQLRQQGAQAVQLDIYDRDQVFAAVRDAAPDVVIHQLTALSGGDLAENARIRELGTRNLVDAARDANVTRIIAQSISFAQQPGPTPATEDVPLDLATTHASRRNTVNGVRALEETVAEIEQHVILRYGLIYGPGTWYSPDSLVARQLRDGTFTPSAGITSFVHVEDAARATIDALNWPPGVYNIVDDEPAPGPEWAEVFAKVVGASTSASVRPAAAWERGADNRKARGRGWQPTHPSWRTGFPALIP